ncbi:MAG: type II secretion system F family protein [Actinomycetota bacterium]
MRIAAIAAACASVSVVSAVAAGRPMLVGGVERTRARPLVGWLGRLGASRFGRLVKRGRLHALAVASDATWSVDELVGAKVLTALLAAAIAAVVFPPLGLPVALAAWRVPELMLARRARRRVAMASREVPLFLDLLAVASSAGVAPQLAVRLACPPLRGPLAAELASAVDRADLGRRWREELGAAAERLGLNDLRRAVAVLGRSEAMGSSLADEMSRLAADVRAERRSRAAERARAAPVKMLFPLVFLILPAFLLLTVVPVLLSTVRSIS